MQKLIKIALSLGLLLGMGAGVMAQERVNIYSGAAPGSLGSHPDIDNPFLLVFLPVSATPDTLSSAVIICPGGGYAALSMDAEGTNVARSWQSHGVAAMVLRYRLPGQDYPHPAPMLDAQRACRLVRSRAGEWHLNPKQIGVMGFSAGGHLASTLETHFDAGNPAAPDPIDRVDCRPDFAVLVYPVISMKDGIAHVGSKNNLLGPHPDPALVESLSNETQVTAETPPTLIVRAADDKTVLPANGDLMLAALQKAGIPSALQEYPSGGHGFGWGRKPDPSPPGWLDAVAQWLTARGSIAFSGAPPGAKE